jgi:hypothetical protein
MTTIPIIIAKTIGYLGLTVIALGYLHMAGARCVDCWRTYINARRPR